MTQDFDPYHEWLGLPRRKRQPNFFELLGIDESQADSRLIAQAADRAASKVRSCRPGSHAAEWARLLDQIAVAKARLTDPDQRRKYLQEMAAESAGMPRMPAATSDSAAPPARRPASSHPPGKPSSELSLPMSPMGVPYLRPVENGDADSPPHPMTPHPMAPHPMAPHPMAPHPMAPAFPGAAHAVPEIPPVVVPSPMMPGTHPMSPVLPTVSDAQTPYRPPAVPRIGPAGGFGSARPSAETPSPLSRISLLAPGSQPAEATAFSTSPPVPESIIVPNPSSPSGRRGSSGLVGPVFVGIGVGLTLLAILAGFNYLQAPADSTEVALAGDSGGDSTPADLSDIERAAGPAPSAKPGKEDVEAPAVVKALTVRAVDSTAGIADAEKRSRPGNGEESMPAVADGRPLGDPKPDDSKTEPKPTTAADSKPADSKPASPSPVPEMKPGAAEPVRSEAPPEPKKLSPEDLVKLGRAMQKSRDAIGERDFDRASELLNLGGELANDTEHQSQIDRLRLLLDSARQYHDAILVSISKLEPTVTFEFGGSVASVIEVSRERLALRITGQSRTFRVDELPLGLAIALAEQTLAPSDPTNVLLKWAYVIASPKASKEELDRARQYLAGAAAADENAKSLLLILDDKYELGKKK